MASVSTRRFCFNIFKPRDSDIFMQMGRGHKINIEGSVTLLHPSNYPQKIFFFILKFRKPVKVFFLFCCEQGCTHLLNCPPPLSGASVHLSQLGLDAHLVVWDFSPKQKFATLSRQNMEMPDTFPYHRSLPNRIYSRNSNTFLGFKCSLALMVLCSTRWIL